MIRLYTTNKYQYCETEHNISLMKYYLNHKKYKNISCLVITRLNLKKIRFFPKKCFEIDCSDNNLEMLPELPKNLNELCITHNKFKILPKLPVNIRNLSISYNKFKKLPKIDRNILYLNASHNKLKKIQLDISDIRCSYNRLLKLSKHIYNIENGFLDCINCCNNKFIYKSSSKYFNIMLRLHYNFSKNQLIYF